MLNLHIEDHPLARIAALKGLLNAQTSHTLSRILDERFQLQTSHIILDLSEVNELTSIAQQTIFDSHRRSLTNQSGKKIIFCGLNKDLEHLTKITGLSKFIPAYPSTDIALQKIEELPH